MNKIKNNDLTEARKHDTNFRFIDDLNSISDGGKFETRYCDIYQKELGLFKETLINMKLLFGLRYQNYEWNISS